MAEPTGWSWIGTRLLGNQVIVYDRGVDYGEYKYNLFSQTLVKTGGNLYDPNTSADTWRFLIAFDGTVEYFDNASSREESYDSTRAEMGYFSSAHLPWSVTLEDYGVTGIGVGDGYNNTTTVLDKTIYGNEIWSLASYWREFHGLPWFVPSIGEVQELYKQKYYLPSLTASLTQLNDRPDVGEPGADSTLGICRIWSSTESTTDPANYAQILNWRDGSITDYQKDLISARFTLCRYE